ncbi:hypothetical protein RHMOL_Rhmol02G0079700 [Rhododendron molle]|uniref:Uncharacterized protein n=1 Tax=Rhododendron molle TaxID=49168 RepID=A0ACC0PMH0_RHOML|nr:hypothetical protein RHMOL_Rhmol02G0079700 [Rhododendron molle]
MEGTRSSDTGRDDPDFGILCFCGEPSPLRKSTTQKNPGRRFFGCSKYKTQKDGEECGFFCWYEPSIWQERSDLGPMKVQINAKDLTTVEQQYALEYLESKCGCLELLNPAGKARGCAYLSTVVQLCAALPAFGGLFCLAALNSSSCTLNSSSTSYVFWKLL